jgi:hypothetical protein
VFQNFGAFKKIRVEDFFNFEESQFFKNKNYSRNSNFIEETYVQSNKVQISLRMTKKIDLRTHMVPIFELAYDWMFFFEFFLAKIRIGV